MLACSDSRPATLQCHLHPIASTVYEQPLQLLLGRAVSSLLSLLLQSGSAGSEGMRGGPPQHWRGAPQNPFVPVTQPPSCLAMFRAKVVQVRLSFKSGMLQGPPWCVGSEHKSIALPCCCWGHGVCCQTMTTHFRSAAIFQAERWSAS